MMSWLAKSGPAPALMRVTGLLATRHNSIATRLSAGPHHGNLHLLAQDLRGENPLAPEQLAILANRGGPQHLEAASDSGLGHAQRRGQSLDLRLRLEFTLRPEMPIRRPQLHLFLLQRPGERKRKISRHDHPLCAAGLRETPPPCRANEGLRFLPPRTAFSTSESETTSSTFASRRPRSTSRSLRSTAVRPSTPRRQRHPGRGTSSHTACRRRTRLRQ